MNIRTEVTLNLATRKCTRVHIYEPTTQRPTRFLLFYKLFRRPSSFTQGCEEYDRVGIQIKRALQLQLINGNIMLYGHVTCHNISIAIRSHRQAVFFHVDNKNAVKFQALKRIIESER